jgi:hypothetical protein
MSTLERASYHEAGHAVCQWLLGGEVRSIAVKFSDHEWQGWCEIEGLDEPISQATMLLMGGLAEALYTVHRKSDEEWHIDLEKTAPSLRAAFSPPWGLARVTVAFISSIGETSDPLIENVDDLFSDDAYQCARLEVDCEQALVLAIKKVNSPRFWNCISEVASRLIQNRLISGDQIVDLALLVRNTYSL